jgi:hypothetical protein
LRGAEILEFGRVCPSLLRQLDEVDRPLQIPIVIGSDIGYEICGGVRAYLTRANLYFHVLPLMEYIF